MAADAFETTLKALFNGDNSQLDQCHEYFKGLVPERARELVEWLAVNYGEDDKLTATRGQFAAEVAQWLCTSFPIKKIPFEPEVCIATAWRLTLLYLNHAHNKHQNPKAQYLLADVYNKGVPGLLNKSRKSACALLKASAGNEYGPAEFDMARTFEGRSGELGSEALRWCERAAKHGHGPAQFRLAEYCQQKGDVTGSLKWLQSAAENDVAEAHCSLGLIQMEGAKTKEDLEAALLSLEKAAKLGNSRAQFELAAKLLVGVDGIVEENRGRAYSYIVSAANAGYKQADEQLRRYDVFRLGALVFPQQQMIQALQAKVVELENDKAHQEETIAALTLQMNTSMQVLQGLAQVVATIVPDASAQQATVATVSALLAGVGLVVETPDESVGSDDEFQDAMSHPSGSRSD